MRIGQIETNYQYGLKRKNSHYYNMEENSLLSSKANNLIQQNNNVISKPLQDSVKTQISFKGFGIKRIDKTLKPIIKVIPNNLTEKVFDSLNKISKEQYKYYTKIKNEYINYILTNEKFRQKNGISNEILEELQKGKLIYIPKPNIARKFVEQVFSPINAIYNKIEKLILPKNSPRILDKQEKQRIFKNFAALEGLIKSHEIWENGYRKFSGHSKLTDSSKFLIPDDILLGKITRRRNKVVDPNKGKYSSNSLMIGNRLISGIVYSYFLGTDAYNTTMRYSNNKQEATMQRNSRVAQEFSRIGLNMYIQNLLFGTFETAVNRSLPTAMFVSGSTVAFSEILGRKLVGKPIMPSNKQTLDRLEQEMAEKKGILPSIGRLLTNVKKKEQLNTNNATKNTHMPSKANDKTFKNFAKKKEDTTSNSLPSFKGYYKVEKLIDKNKIKTLSKILEQADEQVAKTLKESILKSIRKSNFYQRQNIEYPTDFRELMAKDLYYRVPIGTEATVWGKWTKSILVPVTFIKDTAKSLYINARNLLNTIQGKKNNTLAEELKSIENTEQYKKFMEYYHKRIELPVWKTSSLSENEKMLKIFAEHKEIAQKKQEEIEGTKNILLWLDKQITKENIKIQKDGTLSPIDLKKVQNILKDSVMRADGEKQLEYDGNTLAQTNINLSRAITTLFLITDAYNLTMQYSNDNRKDANKSAKNRAAQEISRISVSAYMMAFVHNLLSKLCNSSLAGAFTLTALTSTINDSISREVVGVPLTPKTQEELEEIDKQNQKSKSPIKKALAYSIGKKSALPKQTQTIQHEEKLPKDFFANEFFIKPQIN